MIVIDTDFLSAFIKINRTGLIFTVLDTTELVITGAVFNELEQSTLFTSVLQLLNSKKNKLTIKAVRSVTQSEPWGLGELESIAFAKKTNALLLTNDRSAVEMAEKDDITVMDIPRFLLYCKRNNVLSLKEIKQIISDLRERDYYEFSEEVKKLLLR